MPGWREMIGCEHSGDACTADRGPQVPDHRRRLHRGTAQELIEVAQQRAASKLEARPAGLRFSAERSVFEVAGDPDASVPLASLAQDERLVVRTVFTQPGATFPFGTHVAVVEVDTETGKVVLRRMVTVDDASVVLNPLLAEGQRHGVLSFELADMQTPTSYNPLGAKGIGEAGTIGATPAVQNAVVDALAHLGVRNLTAQRGTQY
jgi:aerobic carbon-monoxide dehydrogenase large subunit